MTSLFIQTSLCEMLSCSRPRDEFLWMYSEECVTAQWLIYSWSEHRDWWVPSNLFLISESKKNTCHRPLNQNTLIVRCSKCWSLCLGDIDAEACWQLSAHLTQIRSSTVHGDWQVLFMKSMGEIKLKAFKLEMMQIRSVREVFLRISAAKIWVCVKGKWKTVMRRLS